MWLICGLGNIGNQYNQTRHNVGFDFLDILGNKYKTSLQFKEKFKGELAQVQILGHNVILAKPHTYMNLSAQCLQPLASYYKIPLENIIVIHDDLDLDVGRIKVKIGGGSAGHNGLKSIDQAMGKDYLRIRIGIGRPNHDNISAYVLSKFKSDERELIEFSLADIANNLPLLFEKKLDQFMQAINKQFI
jgi:PTH1 family peptidyl-tRNA hydrolase